MNLIERIATQQAELAEELRIVQLIANAKLPEPRHISSKIICSYKVDTISEAVPLLKQFWPYLLESTLSAEKGFLPSLKPEPKKSDRIVAEHVCILLNTQYHYELSTKLSSRLDLYVKIQDQILRLWIDIANPPIHVKVNIAYWGKTNRSQIKSREANYYGLETGMIYNYKSASEWPCFLEYWQGIDAEDLEDIFINHASRY